MKCVICKHGQSVKGITTITLAKDNATIVFKKVPAMICDNCGEEYLDGTISKELLIKAKRIIQSGVEVDIRNYQNVA